MFHSLNSIERRDSGNFKGNFILQDENDAYIT